MPRELNGPLRDAYETIRDLLAQAGRVDVRTRHDIGAIILEVKRSKHKYGTRAVLQLADALETDEQTLYRCASVADCWTATEMDALLLRTTPGGQPLTWSHFVLLAAVPSADERAALFDRTIREGLAVRTLGRLVDGADGAVDVRTLDRIVRTTERLVREMESAHRDLLERLAVVPRDPQTREAIELVIAATGRLRSLIDEQSERLRAHCNALPTAARERPPAQALAGMA